MILRHPLQALRAAPRFARLELADRRAGRALTPVLDRTAAMGARDIVLVSCQSTQACHPDAFAAHYRALGVGHFLMIDTGAGAGLEAWVRSRADASLWRAPADAGPTDTARWRNDLLRRLACDRWCVLADTDEFLVFPNMATRTLPDLAQFLFDDYRDSLHAIRIATSGAAPGTDPLAARPHVAPDGYVQTLAWGNTLEVRSGDDIRAAADAAGAPALNRIAFLRWRRHYHFRTGTREAFPRRLNRPHAEGTISTTGVLLHIGTPRAPGPADVAYDGPEQLLSLGLMSAGQWF